MELGVALQTPAKGRRYASWRDGRDLLLNGNNVESKVVTKEYCKTLLNDADAMRRYEASRTGINKRDFLLSDVGGCQDVMAALRGERAPVVNPSAYQCAAPSMKISSELFCKGSPTFRPCVMSSRPATVRSGAL